MAGPPGGPARNPIRYRNDIADGGPRVSFATVTGRALFLPRPTCRASGSPDDDYPLTLNTGRLPHQWHTLTKTGKVAKLNELNPAPFVEIHPDDAQTRHRRGRPVEVASRRGRAVLPACHRPRAARQLLRPVPLERPFGEYLSVNAVTNDAVDPISFQPEFKVCAVSLAKVAAAADGRRSASSPPPAGRPSSPARDVVTPAFHDHDVAIWPASSRDWTQTRARQPRHSRRRPLPTRPCPVGRRRARRDVLRAPPADPGASRRRAGTSGVTVLWASQTGNAEQVAAVAAERLAAHGFAPSCSAMDAAGAGGPPRRHRRAGRPSTFGAGEPPTTVLASGAPSTPPTPDPWTASVSPCSPWATPATPTSAHTVAASTSGCTHSGPAVAAPIDCEPDFDVAAALVRPGRRRPSPTGHRPRGPDRGRTGPAVPGLPPRRQPDPIEPAARPARRQPVAQPAPAAPRRSASSSSTRPGRPSSTRPATRSGLAGQLPRPRREWLELMGADATTSSTSTASATFELVPALATTSRSPGSHRSSSASSPTHARDRDLQCSPRSGDADALARWTWGRQAIDLVADPQGSAPRRSRGSTCSSGSSRGSTRSPRARSSTRTASG